MSTDKLPEGERKNIEKEIGGIEKEIGSVPKFF